MKYDIVISEGCTAFYTNVNGKDINDLTPEERNEFLDYLLVAIKTRVLEQNIDLNSLIDVLPCDDYESDPTPCDQCGDTVVKSFYKI